MGADTLLIGCNTAHFLLPEIYKAYPCLENRITNIVDTCIEYIKGMGISKVSVLGTEGTLTSGLYQEKLQENNIDFSVPGEEDYSSLRNCMEAVKQNQYSEKVFCVYDRLVRKDSYTVLACTELPILHERYLLENNISDGQIIDPIEIALRKIREELSDEEDTDGGGV